MDFLVVFKGNFPEETHHKKLKLEFFPTSVLDVIKICAKHEVVMRITYKTREGNIIYRWVEPYSFRVERGIKYLYAWCRIHKHIHKWIFFNILDATFSATGLKYSNPMGIKVEIT